MDFAVKCKDERDSMLGDRVRRITRYASHTDAQCPSAFQIYVVESGTTQRNQSDARSCQALEDFAIDHVINKNGDHGRAASTERGLRL
jgi:hypothetical protein